MTLGSDLRERAFHDAVCADHEAYARDAPVLERNAERLRNLARFVGGEQERQRVLFGERAVRIAIVARNANHDCARALELLVQIANFLGFYRATRRVVFGIEVHNHGLTAQAGQGDGLPGVHVEGDIGSTSARRQDGLSRWRWSGGAAAWRLGLRTRATRDPWQGEEPGETRPKQPVSWRR